MQDLWQIAKPFELVLGIRSDWDRLIQHGFVAPRVAANFFPLGEGRTKLTVSWGLFTAALDLNTIAHGFDQERTDVFYDSAGLVQLPGSRVTQFFSPPSGLDSLGSQRPASNGRSGLARTRISVRLFCGVVRAMALAT